MREGRGQKGEVGKEGGGGVEGTHGGGGVGGIWQRPEPQTQPNGNNAKCLGGQAGRREGGAGGEKIIVGAPVSQEDKSGR